MTIGITGTIFGTPGLGLLWMALMGLGQGASISLALSYIVWRSATVHHSRFVSTMAQGFGYLFASLGPICAGALYGRTGGWAAPGVMFYGLLAIQITAATLASRDRYVFTASSGAEAVRRP